MRVASIIHSHDDKADLDVYVFWPHDSNESSVAYDFERLACEVFGPALDDDGNKAYVETYEDEMRQLCSSGAVQYSGDDGPLLGDRMYFDGEGSFVLLRRTVTDSNGRSAG